ncbi:cytidine deaminase-like protein [Rhodocollybia butyracea]|uniref:Deoxycytidylate deaminase n=1 Tax=Rhodocollybia butyracea TaxID=206335 RepID=A0A9P5UE19_9AGAR|nr:cytidine deaminase-like protein [Rhodocollybia butyracea]
MFIAIIGTRSCGCSTLENYLVASKGFTVIRLELSKLSNPEYSPFIQSNHRQNNGVKKAAKHLSFLTFTDATPLQSPLPFSEDGNTVTSSFDSNRIVPSLSFSTPEEILDYVTCNWRSNFVTTDLGNREVLETFIKRPFFLLLSLDAPLTDRYRRSHSNLSFQSFVAEDDERRFGRGSSSLHEMTDWINLRVVNDHPTISAFHAHIECLDLLNPVHLRPDWDTYFMTLASLASQRSNCMKRRVGAILVRDKRIVSTGYNGTPRGVRNCNEGGCARCNEGAKSESDNDECLCLHAEENALLEAGRERVGKGSVLYCNTCPCLKCTVKIIQTGVECVIYNLSYKVDAASAKLFAEAGVQLRRFDPARPRLSVLPKLLQDDSYDTSTIDMNASDEDNDSLLIGR